VLPYQVVDLNDDIFFAAERFALPALGRAWTMLGSRKNSKPACLGDRPGKNASKSRRLPHVRCTNVGWGETSYFIKGTGAQTGVYCKWQTYKPYKAMESASCDSRGAPWFPINMMYQLVAQ
jgi:hypothetical protein